MKIKLLIPVAILILGVFAFFYFYNPPTEYKTIQGNIQGTKYTITYQDRASRNLQPKIEALLHNFDMSLSAYEPQSIISKINRNEPVKPDDYFIEVFQKSGEIYKISQGAFDITVGPLVNAWGFGPNETTSVDSTKVDSILKFVGFDKISLEDDKIIKQDPRVQIDVNAIAQGYSVDVVSDFLENKGIKNYMVEIGGELKVKGLNRKNELWKIGIDKPADGNFIAGENLQAIIQISDKAISTSGNYRKFYIKDGVKYAHTINPKTGYPALSKLLSASVMAGDCITADALATAFMVVGLEKSISLVSKLSNIDVYFVFSDDAGNYQSFMTPGMQKALLKEAK